MSFLLVIPTKDGQREEYSYTAQCIDDTLPNGKTLLQLCIANYTAAHGTEICNAMIQLIQHGASYRTGMCDLFYETCSFHLVHGATQLRTAILRSPHLQLEEEHPVYKLPMIAFAILFNDTSSVTHLLSLGAKTDWIVHRKSLLAFAMAHRVHPQIVCDLWTYNARASTEEMLLLFPSYQGHVAMHNPSIFLEMSNIISP